MEYSQNDSCNLVQSSGSDGERVSQCTIDGISLITDSLSQNQESENGSAKQNNVKDADDSNSDSLREESYPESYQNTPRQNAIISNNPGQDEEGITSITTVPPQSEFHFSEKRVWISISIILICYMVTFISLVPICTQYFSYRIAHDKYNSSVNSTDENKCANSTDEDEDFINKVQREASNTILFATIASGIPAIFTCLFVGSYSDFLGRKPLLIAPMSGGIVRIVILLLIIELHLDIELYYVGAFVDGILGSYYTTTLAAMAIIADTSSPGSRAVRFAILEGILFVSGALSQLAIGYLIRESGYFLPVLLCGCLLFVAFLMVVFVMPETVQRKHPFQWNIGVHMKKTFGFYFLEGTKIQRVLYIIGLITFQTLMLTNLGRLNVETLFVMNSPICWDAMDIGIYNAIRLVVMSLVAVVVLGVCKRRISLEATGMICATSAVAGFIVEGFANSTSSMYLSSLVGILYLGIIPIPRALLSQITSPVKQGALFSSLSCFETAASMVSSTSYTLIYNASLDTYKGAVFMVMASLCLLTVVLLGAFRLVRLRNPSSYEHIVQVSSKAREVHEVKNTQNGLDDNVNETSPLLRDNSSENRI